MASPEAKSQRREERSWFHFTNLKVEAAIFLLIALTFAAVLGQGAVTDKTLDITPLSSRYYPYVFSDKDNGGKSTTTVEPGHTLNWSCNLRAGFAYPYCGYGLYLGATPDAKGLDFKHFQDITIRLNYHGKGDHLKLMLKNKLPAALRAKVTGDTDMSLVTEFNVVNGENVVHLKKDQLAIEGWWIASNKLTPEEAKPLFDNVVAVAVSSGDNAPLGEFDVSVHSIKFEGVSISTKQWYLVILGVWLVLTGAFLVYRFLGLRRGYEARQRQQTKESEALASARAAAEAASLAKSQFLANMSHELRTPLNAILGYAQLLKNGDLTSEQRLSAADTIEHSGEHLLTVINDVLDLAKVEAGKMELVSGPVDIRACVQNVAQMIRLRAEEKGLHFTVGVSDDVPQNIVADEKRIRQVLINLLGNAVKFTEAGEVRLEVSVVSIGDANVRLRFAITDSGIGIRADQFDRVFRAFEQAGNAIDRSGGTGLGLSITHQIVQMMSGTIRVESTLGCGSSFTVEASFPLTRHGTVTQTARLAHRAQETAPADQDIAVEMSAPSGEIMDRLLAFARSGNMRGVRKEIPAIIASGTQYQAFAERLDALAAAYQTPAVLRLIEQHAQERDAA
ncbi:ATP-binding protein [Asticcacaulis sp. EMRT-3]|uniref:sensor histidine kinase n=1 Tax=Asticcacaulis sp. EMRT-3 TaxID=3040349 RepID=UPI0024AFF96B|nr:ATP-binding protein [Asticcacaulis sp. EMRT-3]MDI7776555.1 ATP-binding protein [Asticcacaulis sp. EMRT-3]